MLYTDVYMIPVALSGFLELVTQFTSWFAAPIFGTILDRFTFKKGKYWPWILCGSILMAIVYMTQFTIPFASSNPAGLAFFIFILAVALAVMDSMTNTTMLSCYPKIAQGQADRTFLSSARQVGKNLSQSLFGFLAPLMILFFAGSDTPNAEGWAKTGWILGLLGLVFYVVFAITLKRSKLEQRMVEQRSALASGRKKMSMGAIFKNVFTNRALLAIFVFFALYQLFIFSQSMTASYLFRYYYEDFSKVSIYQSVRTLCTAGGTFLGIFWLKVFKDSKRAFLAANIGMIVSIASLIFLIPLGPVVFIGVTFVQNLFCGIIAALLLPLFAAASDYGTFKTGVRADGLNMSAYTLAIKVGIALSATFRASILAVAGYDAALYTDGVKPTEEVFAALRNLQSVYPLVIAIVAMLIVWFLYPINDRKLAEIREGIARRDAAAQ
jgi:Na+/melibiose symporter-like transporter